jgi:hypothetical protein
VLPKQFNPSDKILSNCVPDAFADGPKSFRELTEAELEALRRFLALLDEWDRQEADREP